MRNNLFVANNGGACAATYSGFRVTQLLPMALLPIQAKEVGPTAFGVPTGLKRLTAEDDRIRLVTARAWNRSLASLLVH